MKAIIKNELRQSFRSITGWLLISVVLLLFGIFFSVNNLSMGYANFEYVVDSMLSMLILIVPVLTMRSYADEWKMQTYRMLYSAPVRLESVVLGKFISAVAIFLIPVLIACLYPLILCRYGECPLPEAYNSLLGFCFLGAALISVGQFLSAALKNSIIAGLSSIAFFLFSLLLPQIIELIPTSGAITVGIQTILFTVIALIVFWYSQNWKISLIGLLVSVVLLILAYNIGVGQTFLNNLTFGFLEYFSFFSRMENFIAGILDIKAIIYYSSIIVLFVTLTVQTTDRPRWIK